MRNLNKTIWIFIVISILGCEETLDIPNPNAPTAEIFYNTEEDAIKSVNAIYSRNTSPGINRWLVWLGNLRTDEMKSQSPANAVINNFDVFLIANYNQNQLSSTWRDLYVYIYRANQAIDNIPGIEMNEELKSRLLGEARFLRGWAYFHLALYWGNVPLMLETSKPTDRPETSSRDQVWKQAIDDFQQAAQGLWEKEKYPVQELGRATKGAAYAMLGKTYMMQGEYQLALEALSWLVTGPGASTYDLVADYRNNFLSTTENNIESVYELQYTHNATATNDRDVVDGDLLNWGTSIAPFVAPQPIGFSDMEMNRWVVHEFNELTTDGQRDPRVEASFLYDSTDVRGPAYTIVYGRTWQELYPDPNSNLYKRIHLRKFLNDATQLTETFVSPNNYRNIRYADVLLLYAECLNEVGRTSEAYPFVNEVRGRVGLEPLETAHPEIGNDAELFLKQLKHERITELAGEGHRWADLMRWGDLSPQLADRDAGFTNFIVGKHELLPIPQQDLDYNPNMEQNPKW